MWHEARRSEKKVHDMMDAARKRAQRRAVFLAKRRGDPMQSIQLMGNRSRMYRDDGLYQATHDQQGLIPWNGKQDVLIDRFDGRALLDFIRESGTRRAPQKSEEEEELEEFVNFERYRDLIKHRRRGFTDEEGLQHVYQELEAKFTAPFASDSNSQTQQHPASKGPYSQVGFSYDGDGKEETHFSDGGDSESEDEDDDEDEDFNSDDSNDEGMETIAKEFGVKRFGWLVFMDKKAKEEEKRQKEVIKGDPAIRKMSRKERKKASQIERERDREAARITGTRVLHHDPYRESRRSPTYEAYSRSRRSRSRSRSYSPSHSRRYTRGGHPDEIHHSKSRTPKIEYITEFGGSSKLTKASTSGGPLKQQQGEKKETPQERLKRIMSKQLNKQIKKDTATEMAKKREQERHRQEKLAETNQLSRYRRRSRSRSYSRSPPRRYRSSRSPSRSRSSRRHHSRSPSPSRSRNRTRSRSHSYSRSPRVRSRSRY
ncbi:CLK4-associating serine/arginine rich protein [Salix suchowensis]|nr:CLK4-associating serine/arginine rich protein [Salix suchowensis]